MIRQSVLTDEQLAHFERDGFLVVHGFFDPIEQDRIRDAVEEISDWPGDGVRCLHYRELVNRLPVLARTERFLRCHAGLERLIGSGRLCDAVSDLFAEPAQLFKEKINYKHPGGAGFAAHQDTTAYRGFGTLQITCLVAIDENTLENGCLWFSPGVHAQGLLPEDDSGCIAPEFASALHWQPVPLESGDVVLFSSFAPHKSRSNSSNGPRRSLYITFGTLREGELREEYYRKRDAALESGAHSDRISTIGHFQGRVVES